MLPYTAGDGIHWMVLSILQANDEQNVTNTLFRTYQKSKYNIVLRLTFRSEDKIKNYHYCYHSDITKNKLRLTRLTTPSTAINKF